MKLPSPSPPLGSPPPTPPALFAAIQNSLVGGPILQNVLGTVTSVNQGLLGSGGLLGGGGLLSYGGVLALLRSFLGESHNVAT